MGSITRRGKESWRLAWYVRDTQTGQKRQVFETFRGKHVKAKERLRDLEAAADRGHGKAAKAGTVSEFLAQWLRVYAEPNLRLNTVNRYRELIARISEWFPSTKLDQLTALGVQEFYRELGQSLSAQTILHHHRLLHQALGHAVKWGLLSHSPMSNVDAPRVARYHPRVLTPEEADLLVSLARPEWFRLALLLALYTGMRRSELCALAWVDVDFERQILTVKSALDNVQGEAVLSRPKTEAGTRTVELPAFLVDELREYKARLKVFDLVAATVLADEAGKLRRPKQVTEQFRSAARRAKLDVRLHDCRHTHASWMLGLTDVAVVSHRLGHANPGVTSRIYLHPVKGRERQAVDELNKAKTKPILALSGDTQSVSNRKD